MNILVIGGTRNLGHQLVHALLQRHHQVTIFNRGLTRDELPENVERLHGDRTDTNQLRAALRGRSFDVVVDTALYKADEADAAVKLLTDCTDHYIILSTGQVYLVREDIERPFHEADYEGRLIPAPKLNTFNYEEWLYGVDKRKVEDTLHAAYQTNGFPYTSLRLPMVNSERDHFNRLYAYILRLQDGGPILAPSTPNFALRHVYSLDVVRSILHIAENGLGKGKAYNLSQEETVTLDAFLAIVGRHMGVEPQVVRVRRDLLEANGFLPDASPFSERWMSELDNALSKSELGITYTPLEDYLGALVASYTENPPPTPAGYRRRRAELLLYEQMEAGLVGEM